MSTTSQSYYSMPSIHMPNAPSYGNHPQALPSLRSVLGDQLDLPVRGSYGRHGYDSHYPTNPSPDYHSHRHSGNYSSGYASSSSSSYQSSSYEDRSSSSENKTPSPSLSKERLSTKKYVCSWPGCDKRFERQNALDTHMNIHTDSKPFVCPITGCGKAFNVRSNMRRHLLTHKEYQPGPDIDEEGSPKSANAYPQGPSSRGRAASSQGLRP